jgi:hypothetical protein
LSPFGLQIQNLLNSVFGKDVMIATNALGKPQALQQAA